MSSITIPKPLQTLVHRARAALATYEEQGLASSLEESLHAWEQILESPYFESAEPLFKEAVRNTAGVAFLQQAERSRLDSDLQKAKLLFEKAVSESSPDSPQSTKLFANLGLVHQQRYILTGSVHALSKAIDQWEQVLDHISDDTPDKATYLNNLVTDIEIDFTLKVTVKTFIRLSTISIRL